MLLGGISQGIQRNRHGLPNSRFAKRLTGNSGDATRSKSVSKTFPDEGSSTEQGSWQSLPMRGASEKRRNSHQVLRCLVWVQENQVWRWLLASFKPAFR